MGGRKERTRKGKFIASRGLREIFSASTTCEYTENQEKGLRSSVSPVCLERVTSTVTPLGRDPCTGRQTWRPPEASFLSHVGVNLKNAYEG